MSHSAASEVKGDPTPTRTPWIRVEGQPLGRVPAFDGIRGFFVVLVVLFHAYVVNRLLPGGAVVIDMFFVFSGFLITTLLLDEHRASGAISLRKFYSRRVLRLFPAMYLMIAIFVVVMLINEVVGVIEFREGYSWWMEALGASFYVYHLVYAFNPDMAGAISHTWSLSVEEQFYFLWPALFALAIGATLKQVTRHRDGTGRAPRVGADRWLVLGAAAFVVSMFAIRFLLQDVVVGSGMHMEYADADDPTWQGILYRVAGSRPDMVVFGCLLAIGIRHVPRPVPARWLSVIRFGGVAAWVLLVSAMTLSGRVPGFEAYGGVLYQLAMLGVGIITIDFFLRPDSAIARFFCLKPLQSLGQRSYGIYLWHIPVLWLFLGVLEGATLKKQIALGIPLTGVAIVAGYLSLRYIEKPFLKLKDRKYKRPDDTPVTEVDLRSTAAEPSGAPTPTDASEPAAAPEPAEVAPRSAPTEAVGAGAEDTPR